MKRNNFLVLLVIICLGLLGCEKATKGEDLKRYSGKKIFYINSYHKGYDWSDGIAEAIKLVINESGAELKEYSMDTKRHSDEDLIQIRAREVKSIIDKYHPDVIITSDDNAFKYVIKPYYRDADVPVVFCGINWDASIYGAPYSNTTGMIEIALVEQLVAKMRQYAKGDRVGYIAADVLTARKEGEYYKKIFRSKFKQRFAKNTAEWKRKMISLQKKVDMIIVGNNAGISDWSVDVIQSLVKNVIRIPTGALYTWLMPYSLIGFTKLEKEQGEWAARTALKILDGTPPKLIPITKNKQGQLFINLSVAKSLNILLPPAILKNSIVIDNH